MPKKKKDKQFVSKVSEIRVRRALRDDIFEDVMNKAFGDRGQFPQLRQWIYEDLDDCKSYVQGLEPCCTSNQSRAALDNINDRLARISTKLDDLLQVEDQLQDDGANFDTQQRVAWVFDKMARDMLPTWAELFGLRKELENMFEATS